MKTITLQSCLKGLTDVGWSKIASAIVLLIVVSGRILIRYELDIVPIIGLLALLVFVVVMCLRQRKKDRKIKAENIYLVEDVFLRVDVKSVWSRYGGREEWCTVHFAHHGTFEVVIPKMKEPENPTCDYSAVHFSKPGDGFYLLMLRDGEEERILKCFHKRFYVLSEEDFILTDGEYRPRSEVRR